MSDFRISDHGKDLDQPITVCRRVGDFSFLLGGTVMCRVGGTTDLYRPYNTESDDRAAGILAYDTRAFDNNGRAQATLMVHGAVRESQVIGLDRYAKATLDQILFLD